MSFFMRVLIVSLGGYFLVEYYINSGEKNRVKKSWEGTKKWITEFAVILVPCIIIYLIALLIF